MLPKQEHNPITLSFTPAALFRCTATAQILREQYDEPFAEFGLLGLARRSKPWHIIATPLLSGQQVTSASVFSAGRAVFRLRSEVEQLSRKLRTELVPACFLHRHPGATTPSGIDREFAETVFIDQVASAISFTTSGNYQLRIGHAPGERSAGKGDNSPRNSQRIEVDLELEWAICMSYIFNSEGEYSVFAIRKDYCPVCESARTRSVPVSVSRKPDRDLSKAARERVLRALKREVEAKIRIRQLVAATRGEADDDHA
jgi:hypothetical protein